MPPNQPDHPRHQLLRSFSESSHSRLSYDAPHEHTTVVASHPSVQIRLCRFPSAKPPCEPVPEYGDYWPESTSDLVDNCGELLLFFPARHTMHQDSCSFAL